MYNQKFNHCTHWIFLTTVGLSSTVSLNAAAADTIADNTTLLIQKTAADDLVRAKILDSIPLVDAAKAEFELVPVTTLFELEGVANIWNDESNGKGANSKYVSSVQIDPATGEITITFYSYNLGSIPPDTTLVFTPYIQDGNTPKQLATALAAKITGVIDWGCASVTNAIATKQGLPALTLGTLPSLYAPWYCN